MAAVERGAVKQYVVISSTGQYFTVHHVIVSQRAASVAVSYVAAHATTRTIIVNARRHYQCLAAQWISKHNAASAAWQYAATPTEGRIQRSSNAYRSTYFVAIYGNAVHKQ